MNKHKLLAEFLETWSIDRLRNMSIEEYTNLNKSDSFCYWLEQRTNDLGGITGGSSFKFGIYKRNNTEKEISTSNGLTDGEYAWFDKYGQTRDEAFQKVRNIIVQIAEFAINNDFDKIEEIDLGEATKWKIAFLYSDYQLINTFSKDMVCSILDFLQINYSYDESRFSLSNKILSQKKDYEDFFEFGSKFWNETLISQGLKKILKKLGNRVFSYFEIMDRVVENFNLEPNNEKYYFSFNSKELIFTIGQRYIWNLTKNEYKYISLNKCEEIAETFGRENQEPEAYLNYSKNPENFTIILDRMSISIQDELEGTNKASHRNQNKKDLQELVFNKEFRNKVLKSLNISASDSELIINKPMNKITQVLQFKKQIILQGPPGTGKTREAKQIAKDLIGLTELKDSEQLKLIQFHPSYTYEDFVRGIVSKPNEEGDGIIYEAENKILAEFAKKALDNYLDSKKAISTISKEKQVKKYFDLFTDHIGDEIEKSEGFYSLTNSVGLITSTDEDAFRYKGLAEGWLKGGNRMLYKDIIQAYLDNNQERQDIKNNQTLSGLARQHASYFIRVLNLFQEYLKVNNLKFNSESETEKVKLQNYVLIIDEINRSNLSSVLGELIYALEYRGEAVESMYDIDGDSKLILPPNLYIIGTMNTADRSVGHIDYAIRRRFAFVDVLPKDLSNEEGVLFDSTLFNQVSELFETNLSPEFEKKDVQLGHSYFIDKSKKGGSMDIRLEYEIKPILLEYVKDGVLIGDEIKQKIEELETSI
ncbi:McrB family protein [Empedobacter stercoris]|uniref:McrB family protein n=1 Tax=Empedobacter stercoris TaxID=1628248 RepID=UPI001CE0EA1D|nr:AAA family ATPase [Empedobacter stercoris]